MLPNFRYALGKNDLARLGADEDTPLLWLAIVLLERGRHGQLPICARRS